MAFCNNCGHDINKGVLCAACVNRKVPLASESSSTDPPDHPPTTSSSFLNKAFQMAMALLIASAIVLLLLPKSPEEKAAAVRAAEFLRKEKLARDEKAGSHPKMEEARVQKEKFAKEHDATWVYAMSKQFIKKGLKTPSSADFPSAGSNDVNVIKTGDARYLVSAYVDAQNAFGAKLRSNWICELEYVGGGDWNPTPGACGLL